MRILIAARHAPDGPKPIGGVQSWCATVGDELRRRGHEVVFYQPGRNLIGSYDFGIFANISDTRMMTFFCDSHVTICHGIIAPEKPPLNNVAFTSEEVRDHWHAAGPIVRQPINLGFWRPRIAKERYLVRFSYRAGLDFVPAIAESMGLEYVHIRSSTPIQARETLTQAACVLATGRGAVEAMACGVPVIICDDRTYQTPLLDLDILGSMSRNYSGRGGVAPTPELVRGAIEMSIRRGNLRSHVRKHHDVRTITDQLLEMRK